MMHEAMQMSAIQLPAEVAGFVIHIPNPSASSLSPLLLVPSLAFGGVGVTCVGAPIPLLSLTPTESFN